MWRDLPESVGLQPSRPGGEAGAGSGGRRRGGRVPGLGRVVGTLVQVTLVEFRLCSAAAGSLKPVKVVLPAGAGVFCGGGISQVLGELQAGAAVVVPEPHFQVPAAAVVLHEHTQPLPRNALGEPRLAGWLPLFVKHLEAEA